MKLLLFAGQKEGGLVVAVQAFQSTRIRSQQIACVLQDRSTDWQTRLKSWNQGVQTVPVVVVLAVVVVDDDDGDDNGDGNGGGDGDVSFSCGYDETVLAEEIHAQG